MTPAKIVLVTAVVGVPVLLLLLSVSAPQAAPPLTFVPKPFSPPTSVYDNPNMPSQTEARNTKAWIDFATFLLKYGTK